MDLLFLIGRLLFAVVFFMSGIGHLRAAPAMAGYASSKGVPAGSGTVAGTGVLIIIGSVMLALGLWPDLGALLLFAFILPTAFLMHAYWRETDPMARMNERSHFLKDISLAGAALALFAILTAMPEVGYTITDPVFSAD